MALIECPECKHQISDTASTCPNCGYNLKYEKHKPIFKRIIVLILTILIVFAFSVAVRKFVANEDTNKFVFDKINSNEIGIDNIEEIYGEPDTKFVSKDGLTTIYTYDNCFEIDKYSFKLETIFHAINWGSKYVLTQMDLICEVDDDSDINQLNDKIEEYLNKKYKKHKSVWAIDHGTISHRMDSSSNTYRISYCLNYWKDNL